MAEDAPASGNLGSSEGDNSDSEPHPESPSNSEALAETKELAQGKQTTGSGIDQQAEGEKKAPPVDLIELDVELLEEANMSPEDADSGTDPMAERRKKAPPVDPTKLEVELLDEANMSPEAADSGIDSMADRRKKAPPVDKTKLDVDLLRAMATTTKADQESKLREELESRPAEQPKPLHPIEHYRMSAPCSSICKNTDSAERVSFCDRCHLRVYDFNGMEQPEAEGLIFKMEGRRNVVLFKRPDGKFLTYNCPVGLKQKLMNTSMLAAGFASVVTIVVLSLMQSPSQPQQVANPAETIVPVEKVTTSNSDQTTKTDDKPVSTSFTATPGNPHDENVIPVQELSRSNLISGRFDTGPQQPLLPDRTSAVAPTTPTESGTATQSVYQISPPANLSGQQPQPYSPASPRSIPGNPPTQVNTTQSPGSKVVPTAPASSATEVPATVQEQSPSPGSSSPQNQNSYVKNYR